MCNEIEFVREKHIKYLNAYTTVSDAEELIFNETLKMCGVFYFICSCKILSYKIDKKEEFIDFILKCQNSDGGFGNNIKHDSHIVSTHYAILSLLLLNYSFDNFNIHLENEKNELRNDSYNSNDCDGYLNNKKTIRENTCHYILTLSNDDGSFKGDMWGEVDTRFVYSAVSCLTILNKLNLVSTEKISSYLLSNYDLNENGFSWVSGNEPHAASVFCCVATLFLIQKLYLINEKKVADWLSLRQTSNGGFNGRAEKLTDTCYSWWIFSSLIVLKRYKWINKNALKNYILLCQDLDNGGISDNPDCLPDICHTFFGLAALSLIDNLNQLEKKLSLKEMHPVYAIPLNIVKKRNLLYHDIDIL
ncbi:geranylgeranyltransferase, putative [Plasmodium relictum]|uniref:Geranylgeranyl transferase type-2 subunit beta n=1 Tax=Plasmodium relictum TaxID=85471 RepID=A0A1J1H8Z8_PLARL|nr:geranylgeranyltransferase, putative [Plasmodium relictum]CRH01109.1 geranylgeranyltransferase, putative [Plasmodium relictum]